MTAQTKSVLLALLKSDGTITAEQREAALLALQSPPPSAIAAANDTGRVLRPKEKELVARMGVSRKNYVRRGLLASVYAHDPGRVLRPQEVAAILRVSSRTLRDYGRRGLLVSVYAPDKPSRRLGYTEASVRAFINADAEDFLRLPNVGPAPTTYDANEG